MILYGWKESLMSVCCVCVCRFGISFTYVIESIDSKLISVCSYCLTTYFLFMNALNYHSLPFHSNIQRWNFLYQITLLNIMITWIKIFCYKIFSGGFMTVRIQEIKIKAFLSLKSSPLRLENWSIFFRIP